MDAVDRICSELCLAWQAIGRYYDDPRVILIFGAIVLLLALIILRTSTSH